MYGQLISFEWYFLVYAHLEYLSSSYLYRDSMKELVYQKEYYHRMSVVSFCSLFKLPSLVCFFHIHNHILVLSNKITTIDH